MKHYTLSIVDRLEGLPDQWNSIVAPNNRMLSKDYFQAVNGSMPSNMSWVYVCFYKQQNLIGGAVLQELTFEKHYTFGDYIEKSYKIFQWIIKRLGKRVLILGNNMLSGQNGFHFDATQISEQESYELLSKIESNFNKQKRKPCLLIFKDYKTDRLKKMENSGFWRKYSLFSVQPSMILWVDKLWVTTEDYLSVLSTKYRTRAKAARKKMRHCEYRELKVNDLEQYQLEMMTLYKNVVRNASFNTFYLEPNHFIVLKKKLKSNFLIYGYFESGQLIGFYSMIKNHEELETYFLGYDAKRQKVNQIYLNMLLDIVTISIRLRFKRINFGRTALEIKSTIGAIPLEQGGFMKHKVWIVNVYLKHYFSSFYKPVQWVQRRPFK